MSVFDSVKIDSACQYLSESDSKVFLYDQWSKGAALLLSVPAGVKVK